MFSFEQFSFLPDAYIKRTFGKKNSNLYLNCKLRATVLPTKDETIMTT